MKKAADIYRRFHLKPPNGYVKLKNRIPENMAFLSTRGRSLKSYAVDIGYNSDKWNENGRFEKYVHFFEHETIVLVSKNHELAKGSVRITPPNEVTYLGYAMDFHFCHEDRSALSRNENKLNVSLVEDENDRIKVKGTTLIAFDDNPETSNDYVVSDADGRMVFIICDNEGIIYAFINNHLEITSHGIEG